MSEVTAAGDRTRTYEAVRSVIAPLVGDDALVELVEIEGSRRGWWPRGGSWRRDHGRLDASGDRLATVLFERAPAAAGEHRVPQELCTVEVWRSASAAPAGEPAVVLDGVLWCTLSRFPHDPALPSLRSVLDAEHDPHVLRYRPGHRCTMRAGGGDVPVSYLKVLAAGPSGEAIAADATALWDAAGRGELGVAVAEPLGWDPASRTIRHAAVAGVPAVHALLAPDGPALAEAMGRAAASLTLAPLTPSTRTGRDRQMKRSRKYAGRIATSFPGLAGRLDELLSALDELHRHDTDDRLRPIHGAPHPHQWLLDGDRLGLVDFDGFALGPPELDVATFVTEVRFERPDRAPLDAIVSAFRAGYEDVAGPLRDEVLRAYLAHKRLAKALRTSRALRSDNDVRTAATIEDALAACSSGA